MPSICFMWGVYARLRGPLSALVLSSSIHIAKGEVPYVGYRPKLDSEARVRVRVRTAVGPATQTRSAATPRTAEAYRLASGRVLRDPPGGGRLAVVRLSPRWERGSLSRWKLDMRTAADARNPTDTRECGSDDGSAGSEYDGVRIHTA